MVFNRQNKNKNESEIINYTLVHKSCIPKLIENPPHGYIFVLNHGAKQLFDSIFELIFMNNVF